MPKLVAKPFPTTRNFTSRDPVRAKCRLSAAILQLQLSLLLILPFLTVLSASSAIAGADDVDYCLLDMTATRRCVSEYRGKWLIINFWATWCPPCIEEMPELQRFYERHRALATIWGVTFEDSDKDRIHQFIERLGITYPILGYDQDPLTGYGKVKGLPTTFIIDPQGLFQRRLEGPITMQDLLDEIPQLKP